MKQTLQLRVSQHLALTPQLQQSIRLLQLSTLELHQELEQMLSDNPLLERLDDPLDHSVRLLSDGAISQAPLSAPADSVGEGSGEVSDPVETSAEGTPAGEAVRYPFRLITPYADRAGVSKPRPVILRAVNTDVAFDLLTIEPVAKIRLEFVVQAENLYTLHL